MNHPTFVESMTTFLLGRGFKPVPMENLLFQRRLAPSEYAGIVGCHCNDGRLYLNTRLSGVPVRDGQSYQGVNITLEAEDAQGCWWSLSQKSYRVDMDAAEVQSRFDLSCKTLIAAWGTIQAQAANRT